MSQRCPSCNGFAWPDDKFGKPTCPQCLVVVRLRKGRKPSIEPQAKFRSNTSGIGQAQKDAAVINGLVICACCQKPFAPTDTMDGRIETDGKQIVSVQVGWTLIGDTFWPAMQPRFIPRNIRGRICYGCSNAHGGHQVNSAEDREKRKRSLPYEKTWQTQSDTNSNGLPRDLDPDVEWAHSGNSAWVRGVNPSEKWHTALAAMSHWKTQHCEPRWNEVAPIALDIIRPWVELDRLSLRYRGMGRANTLTRPTGKQIWPYRPQDAVRSYYRREYLPLADRSPKRPVVDASDVLGAVKVAMSIGDALGAYRYARLLARSKAARAVMGWGL